MSENVNEIIIESQSGSIKAFRILVEKFQSYAFNLAFRMLCNEEDSKDVVQETFIRVWKHLDRFDFSCQFSTWLYRIVTNLCYDRIKARNRKRKVISTVPHTEFAEITPGCQTMESSYDHTELAGLVIKFAEELSPKQRMVFILRDLQDLSIKEVTQITGMSGSAVKSNLYHARCCLRQKLERMESSDNENIS